VFETTDASSRTPLGGASFFERLMLRSVDASSDAASRTPRVTKLNYARYAYRPRLVSNQLQANTGGSRLSNAGRLSTTEVSNCESFDSLYQIYDRSAQTSMDLVDGLVDKVMRKRKMNETSSLRDAEREAGGEDTAKSVPNVTIGALSNLSSLIMPLMVAHTQNAHAMAGGSRAQDPGKPGSLVPMKSSIKLKNPSLIPAKPTAAKHAVFLEKTDEHVAEQPTQQQEPEQPSLPTNEDFSRRKSSVSNVSGALADLTAKSRRKKKQSIQSRLDIANSGALAAAVAAASGPTTEEEPELEPAATANTLLPKPDSLAFIDENNNNDVVKGHASGNLKEEDPSLDNFKRTLDQNANMIVNWKLSSVETSVDYL
jgi:hypothetical protein